MTKALIVVDIQNDFVPGGKLAVAGGDQVISLINALMEWPFPYIVATKDWHPADHGSFAPVHHKQPGQMVVLGGVDQILWPSHCVQHSLGAEFVPGLHAHKFRRIFYKGVDKGIDSYSAFYDNGHLKTTGLGEYLLEKGVCDIFIAGLATDYCVKFSVLDARKLGFNTYVIQDACRAVNISVGDDQRAFKQMQQAGAQLISAAEVPQLLQATK